MSWCNGFKKFVKIFCETELSRGFGIMSAQLRAIVGIK